ncbi:conserved exported protein of unknown function [uncultured Woeseiaceae bacterium]|uniref:DUF4124 domain-containing protein n=1 Tax=uncultured Woeseiaceae bacterium TaxID=1983305 RepID=A0A7D9H7V9_9GAMM|nr:conserved exported protein of unknown function [uncultured Woeseiaceae bacterium]
MRILLTTIVVLMLVSAAAAAAGKTQKLYRWVDSDGIVHFGDSIPAEYSDIERQVVNDHGVTVAVLRAKRSDEEIAEEKRQQELQIVRAAQLQKDRALLATYLSVDEIVLHRDRRMELFQAQSRVTELYLRNLERRLTSLEKEASEYQPYSDDPDAETINPALARDIAKTTDTIERHQANLERFREEEQNVVEQFDGDIDRFKNLKGID